MVAATRNTKIVDDGSSDNEFGSEASTTTQTVVAIGKSHDCSTGSCSGCNDSGKISQFGTIAEAPRGSCYVNVNCPDSAVDR